MNEKLIVSAADKSSTSHGVELWSSRRWLAEVTSWIDAQLSGVGIARAGAVEQVHLRPWGTVLKVPSEVGSVWFKAAGPGTAFEAALYDILVNSVPERVLAPIAADVERAWVLLPDGGPTIGERLEGVDLAHTLAEAMVQYGELQRTLAPRVDDLLRAGVWDMRPSRMSARFNEALARTAELIEARGDAAKREMHAAVSALRPTVASWCEQLMDSALPATLDHNDLHPWNILGDGHHARFYDWGDSVVAHPFAAMLVPFGFLLRLFDAQLDDARFLRARDAYLAGFATYAPQEDLVETLDVACRVAKIARVLTWSRAVQAARDAGESIDETWLAAPIATLASLLDASYLGGA